LRNKFDEQLALLNERMIKMGALCESTISSALRALETHESTLVNETITLADEVDQMERDIETMCLKLLLQQQPVARDLRQISAALKMVTDLERIGHQAAEIAEIVQYLPSGLARWTDQLHDMARHTIHMVTESVGAYVDRDLQKAEGVIAYDDVVDNLFLEVKEELIAAIAADPSVGQAALDTLMIAKYFERIADHAAIVASWVKFSITGVHEAV
jgi:phosphate transport system protein